MCVCDWRGGGSFQCFATVIWFGNLCVECVRMTQTRRGLPISIQLYTPRVRLFATVSVCMCVCVRKDWHSGSLTSPLNSPARKRRHYNPIQYSTISNVRFVIYVPISRLPKSRIGENPEHNVWVLLFVSVCVCKFCGVHECKTFLGCGERAGGEIRRIDGGSAVLGKHVWRC